MSLDSRKVRSFWVVVGITSFLIHFIFLQLYHNRHSKDGFDDLFPVRGDTVLATYTSSLHHWRILQSTWQIVLSYQWLWILYSLTTLCRESSLNILPAHFYISWSASCCFEVGHELLIAREHVLWAWIFSCAGAICRHGCLFFAFYGMFEFLAAYSGKTCISPNKFDVWCQRVLVQNGLLCMQSWSTTTTSIYFSAALSRMFGVSDSLAFTCSLLILAFLVLVWFVLQNFKFEKYTRYTYAEYITLTIILGVLFGECRTTIDGAYAFVLLLLCFSVLLFFFRVSLTIFKEGERRYASDEELEFMI